jgi:hypothetical protein
MSKNPCAWTVLGAGVLLTLAALAGCQAAAAPQPSIPPAAGPARSILDECNNPTPSNRDWCLSMQFPNAE